ncbi:hypothetical protein B0J12DRAFT_220060 [Macrophomina phaseolina]|uniref:Uncharacterized protein n=1 Tax=Macrophomina phaseolina TaxID=35725 RepID=A0ABQ8G3Z8_9PEZI|nr:hypothetical protein B0J12DRAFT_220060 [Macrophomina phaseolina]
MWSDGHGPLASGFLFPAAQSLASASVHRIALFLLGGSFGRALDRAVGAFHAASSAPAPLTLSPGRAGPRAVPSPRRSLAMDCCWSRQASAGMAPRAAPVSSYRVRRAALCTGSRVTERSRTAAVVRGRPRARIGAEAAGREVTGSSPKDRARAVSSFGRVSTRRGNQAETGDSSAAADTDTRVCRWAWLP